MAYATKYLFKWQSANGTTREIRVQKDGYSGSVLQRHLGRAPVLKKQHNGNVYGTSLEFFAECSVDGEFAEFYTSDPKAYKVLLYAGNTLLWQGYITPELYSEPDIAPPYDVQVIATDGIGELKLYDFAAQGTVTLRALFTYLLGYTGLGTDVYLISSIKPGGTGAAGSLLSKSINIDYMVGETCYEALSYLLDTLHATITWWKGAWILARETNVKFSSGKVQYFNTSGNSSTLAGSVVTLGKMRTNDAWPVGQLSTVVDPAKKSVTVQAPWHPVTAFVNSGMDTDSSWTKTNNASFDSTKKAYYLVGNGASNNMAGVSQSISVAGLRMPMEFTGKFCSTTASFSTTYGHIALLIVQYQTGNTTYHLGKDADGNPEWQEGQASSLDFWINPSVYDTDEISAQELSLVIPPFVQNTSYPSGTLTVMIGGAGTYVFNAYLDVVLPRGYQDRLHLDNGARGEGDEVEIAIGRETSDISYYMAFLQGLLLDSGSLITSFKDDYITSNGLDYLSFISRDYARSLALPRLRRTGTVFLESAVSFPPLVFTKGAVDYWLEGFSWDMYEDELEISARSLPTATITVDSEVISEATGTVSSAGSGSSSSMSGGGGTSYWEPDTDLPALLQPKSQFDYVGAKDGLFFYGATLTGTPEPDLYVKTVNGQRVLYSPLALITEGDQIVGDGTPGGGGGGASALYQLDDVLAYNGKVSRYGGASQAQDTDLLVFNGTKWYALQLGSNLSITNGVLNAAGGGGGTTYTSGSVSDLTTGTSTTDMVWMPKVLSDWLAGKNYITLSQVPSYSAAFAISKSNNAFSVAHDATAYADEQTITFDPDTHTGLDASNLVEWGTSTHAYAVKLTVGVGSASPVSNDLVTAAGYDNLVSLINAQVVGVSSVAGKTGAVTLAISDVTGLQSALDGKQAAGNYLTSVPVATSSAIGGIQLGYTASGKNYPVQLSSNKAYVNVPWENTTYSAATTSAAGLMSAEDKTKLNGIAANANNYSLPTASASVLGGIKIGTGLSISDGVVSVTGQTSGTVTQVKIGTTAYNPDSSGIVSLPAYPTVPTNVSAFTNDAGYITSYTDTWRNVYTGGTSRVGTGTNTKAINFAAGSNVTISYEAAGTGSGQSGNANYFNVKIAASMSFSDLTAHPTTIAGYGITDAKIESGVITLGSTTITPLTSHQTLYNLVINNSAGTAQITYKPGTSGTYSLTLTSAMVGLGNVENTKLSTWTGSTAITTLGTISSGTWSATTIAVNKGGTGKTSWTQYGVVYASATTTLAQVSNNTTATRKFLRMVGTGSAAAAPAWDTVTKTDVGLSNVPNWVYTISDSTTQNFINT